MLLKNDAPENAPPPLNTAIGCNSALPLMSQYILPHGLHFGTARLIYTETISFRSTLELSVGHVALTVSWPECVGPTLCGPPPSRPPLPASSRRRPAPCLGLGPPRSRDVGSVARADEPTAQRQGWLMGTLILRLVGDFKLGSEPSWTVCRVGL